MGKKQTVLYIDDEFTNLLLFEEIFREWFEIIIVESGHKALKILEQKPEIKAIVCDMKMPIMNGIEFISKAKTMFPDKVYFILTGFDINQEISEAIHKGLIFKYFQKPLHVDEIYKSINKSIDNS
jgi:two-component system, response regulator, stage 0 sporulation protein F